MSIRSALILLLGLALAGTQLSPRQPAPLTPTNQDQPEETWSLPVNVSKTGAAAQPRLLAAPDGRLQAFWWDRFDGLMTAVLESGGWTGPAPAPIPVDGPRTTPKIILDRNGWVHAFWQIDPDGGALLHAQMLFGAHQWRAVEVVGDSVLLYDLVAGSEGGIPLAYLRTRQTPAEPAGIYLKHILPGGLATPAILVYSSIYTRLLAGENTALHLAESGTEALRLLWLDPRQGQVNLFRSEDGGATWGAGESLRVEKYFPEAINNPLRMVGLPDGSFLSIWQTNIFGGCALYQTRSGPESLPQVSRNNEPVQILPDLDQCPLEGELWPMQDRKGIFWLWGQGTASLTLAAYQTARQQWSQPVRFFFSYGAGQPDLPLGLNDLQAAVAGDTLAVAGMDVGGGDVWVSRAKAGAVELAYQEAPVWSHPTRLSPAGEAVEDIATAIDSNDNEHIIWSQGDDVGPPNSILYTRSSPGQPVRQVEVYRAGEDELARQPALLNDYENRLHLAWSGGSAGAILYRRAEAGEAASPGGWSPVKILSADAGAETPQFGLGPAGQLYILYSVPFNEGRGVYLISSLDHGVSWSHPIAIFEAARAGWPSVRHPALAVDAQGVLHAAWVKASFPDAWPPQGIVYSRSTDGGQSWTEPLLLGGAGNDWPRLAVSLGEVHLFYARTDGGEVWQRRVASEAVGMPWSAALRIPGWENIRLPFGVTASGSKIGGAGRHGTLTLAAACSNRATFILSSFENNAWSPVEEVFLSNPVRTGTAIAVSSRPRGDRLILAFSALPYDGPGKPGLPVLYLTSKEMTEVVGQEDVLAEATPALTAATPTASSASARKEGLVVTAAPDYNRLPLPAQGTIPPFAVGGGLAALVLAVLFTGRVLWKRYQYDHIGNSG